MKEERKNCWESRECGREPGGSKVDELGACPVATEQKFDGVNRGKNSGRFCWVVAATLCEGRVQGTFYNKLMSCMKCPFYLEVERQEGRLFVLSEERLKKDDFK